MLACSRRLLVLAATTLAHRHVQTLVVYAGPTTLARQLYVDNFDFFLRHGLPSSRGCERVDAAVALVLAAETRRAYAPRLASLNATCGELLILERGDRCYDLEAARTAFVEQRSRLPRFDKVVFLNCGLLGPFSDSAPGRFWADAFTDRVDATYKLAGVSINCGGKRGVRHAHVQSMLWATDAIGLAAAIAAGAIYDCGTVVDEAARDELIVRYELGLSRAVLRAGYGVRDAMGADYRDWPAAEAARCVDPWKSGRSRDYAPEQLVFWKVSRQYTLDVLRAKHRMDGLPPPARLPPRTYWRGPGSHR